MNKRQKIDARHLAVRILTRVEKEKAYANLLLRKHLTDIDETRDRQFVTALVNGTLKNKGTIDYLLRRHLQKPMSALPYEARWVLRTGAYQILYMDKVPSAAAVNESVNMVKKLAPRFSGLVNSILHKVADTGWDISWPHEQKEEVSYLAAKYSHPEWMIRRWLKRWGGEETRRLCLFNNEPAPTSIRTNTLKISRNDLADKLRSEGVDVTFSSKSPDGLFINNYGAVANLESFREGLFTVQDESSQLASIILAPKPGEGILDVCSAPGGKSTHLAQLMNNEGSITAVDFYSQKLDLISKLAERLGITIIRTIEQNARELKNIEGKFDKVLVDAPCSGLGVIRRRADLRWQREEKCLAEFSGLQLDILLRASDFVRPGGELLYSTCTIEPEENFEVVKAFREARPDFESVDLKGDIPFDLKDEKDLRQLTKGVWQILPQKHEMDGFFLAKFNLK